MAGAAAGNGSERIAVLGIGGAGNHMIDYMVKKKIDGVKYVTVNTDLSHLNCYEAQACLQIGKELTKGEGTSSSPEMGEKAAEESSDEIKEVIRDVDVVILVGGMGGGTGTGAAPVIARMASELRKYTIAIVTKPLSQLESKVHTEIAVEGIPKLHQYTDSLIVIPYDKLLQQVSGGSRMSLPDFLREADKEITQCVNNFVHMVNENRLIDILDYGI